MKDISNLHEASLGAPSNEVSKVAIQQRQMVSDVGTFIYTDRLNKADERCAKNIDELIPFIFDTQRVLTVMGRDNKAALTTVNDPSQPNSDITVGKYAVTVSVGPASETKRTLAAEQMMAFVNAAPQTAANVMDLVAEAQDWPQSGEFARRFKMLLPPGMVPEDELTPEMKQMQQQNQQLQAAQAQLADALQQAEIAKKQGDAANAEARANLAKAQAYKAILDAQARTADVTGKNEHRDFEQIMATLKEHNDLEHEDRTHDLAVADQQHSQAMDQVDQFKDLATTVQDMKLQRQYREGQADASGASNGE
jgi:hypothetical protein